MKTNEELQANLRQVLRERADRITEADLARPSPHEGAPARRGATRKHGQFLAVAAVVLVVTGLVAVGLMAGRRTPTGERVEQVATEPQGSRPEGSRLRAWPLNGDAPLEAQEKVASPEALARAYITEVVGLPNDWPIQEVANYGDMAVARYILQDVAADVRMAKSVEGRWYVTAATTDHATPSVVDAPSGLDLILAEGPRTNPNGAPANVKVMAADGRVLLEARGRVAGARPEGSAGAAPVWSLQWPEPELPAAVRVDVLDDHDADSSTPEVTVGHWTTAIGPPLFGLPASADPATTEPLFTAPGSPDDVALAYLRDRFPDYPAPGIELESARKRARTFYARWTTADNGEQIATGVVAIGENGDGFGVVVATTDGIDLSRVEVADGRVRGPITTDNINSLFADVFQPDGTPAPGSPRPEGQPEANYRFGTAGGPGDKSLDIDVPVQPGSAVLRVNLVGGTILSITEVRLLMPGQSD